MNEISLQSVATLFGLLSLACAVCAIVASVVPGHFDAPGAPIGVPTFYEALFIPYFFVFVVALLTLHLKRIEDRVYY